MIAAFIPLIGSLIERIFPDPTVAASAKLELAKMEASGELQQILAQLDINKVEAASTSLLVSGGRPFVIWVCGAALAYTYIIAPFIASICEAFGNPLTLPNLNIGDLLGILGTLLGLGGMRSYDKIKGVA